MEREVLVIISLVILGVASLGYRFKEVERESKEKSHGIHIILQIQNIEDSLEAIIRTLYFQQEKEGLDFKLYIYEEGSEDQTPLILKRLAKIYPQIEIVDKIYLAYRFTNIHFLLNGKINYLKSIDRILSIIRDHNKSTLPKLQKNWEKSPEKNDTNNGLGK